MDISDFIDCVRHELLAAPCTQDGESDRDEDEESESENNESQDNESDDTHDVML